MICQGVTSKHKKRVLKEHPNTFEKACHFSARCSYLDELNQNLYHSQLVHLASSSQNFQKDYGPMDLDLCKSSSLIFTTKKKNKGYYSPQSSFGPAYTEIQPQTRHCFICNKPSYAAQDCWYNPANQQPSATNMQGRGRQNPSRNFH